MYTTPLRGQPIYVVNADVDDLDLSRFVSGQYLRMILVIGPGVTVGCTDATQGAIFSSLTVNPAISSIDIVNNGTIKGCNGVGGKGARTGFLDNTPGTAGGSGIYLTCPISMDNLGTIQGGGGGGGGGGSNFSLVTGGGGGGGFPGGAGGGDGGLAGDSSQYLAANGGPGGASAGDGGNCNGPGLAGSAGGNGPGGSVGKAGGAAGYSIDSGGNGITYINMGTLVGATN